MTESDRDRIFLLFALTESAGALRALDEVERLAAVRERRTDTVEVRENGRVFDAIRSALQYAANVSKVFWPHSNAAARGEHLRTLTGIPDSHSLRNRALRNHVEHLDERLDDWTAESPRPFLTFELVWSPDLDANPNRREVENSVAVIYNESANEVRLFGEVFRLADLRAALLDVQGNLLTALSA